MPILLKRERSRWLRDLKISVHSDILSLDILRNHVENLLNYTIPPKGPVFDYCLAGTAYQKIASDLLFRGTGKNMDLNTALSVLEVNVHMLSKENLQALVEWLKKITEYELENLNIENMYSIDISREFNIFTANKTKFNVDLDVDEKNLIFIKSLKRVQQFFDELVLFLPPKRDVCSIFSFKGLSKVIIYDNFLEFQVRAKGTLIFLREKLFALNSKKSEESEPKIAKTSNFSRSNSAGVLSPASPLLSKAQLRRLTLSSSTQDFQPPESSLAKLSL